MKYWQKESGKMATRSNVPHLYLYTWIRVSFWFTLIINSIIMFFITKENSFLDNLILRDDIFCIEMAFLGLIEIYATFSPRKVDRTLDRVVIDVILVGIVLFLYSFGNASIILFYIIELVIIAYLGIKIDGDNRVVDNNRIVLWWKRKQKERFDRQIQRFLDKHEIKNVKLTEEQKLKRMSRKQRKEYKKKNI